MERRSLTWLSPRFAERVSLRLRWFIGYCVLLTLAFAGPVVGWARLGLNETAYSHVLLIPFVSAWFMWRAAGTLPPIDRGLWPMAFGLGLAAAFLLAVPLAGWSPGTDASDSLFWRMGAYVLLLWAGGFAAFGGPGMRHLLFPAGFLLFLIPLPSVVVQRIEGLLQGASAEAAHLLFLVSGETLLRDGLVFHLPGLSVEVARECSGIRSTLVLFITGVLAAKLLLDRTSRRLLLVGLVLPIAILRNGFRVWFLATLTVHVNTGIIDSALHRHGGPLFFVLSLTGLLACAWLLMKDEQRRPRPIGTARSALR